MNDYKMLIDACANTLTEFHELGNGVIKIEVNALSELVVDTKNKTVEWTDLENQEWAHTYEGVINKMKKFI